MFVQPRPALRSPSSTPPSRRPPPGLVGGKFNVFTRGTDVYQKKYGMDHLSSKIFAEGSSELLCVIYRARSPLLRLPSARPVSLPPVPSPFRPSRLPVLHGTRSARRVTGEGERSVSTVDDPRRQTGRHGALGEGDRTGGGGSEPRRVSGRSGVHPGSRVGFDKEDDRTLQWSSGSACVCGTSPRTGGGGGGAFGNENGWTTPGPLTTTRGPVRKT